MVHLFNICLSSKIFTIIYLFFEYVNIKNFEYEKFSKKFDHTLVNLKIWKKFY